MMTIFWRWWAEVILTGALVLFFARSASPSP
jgi:hypothetical protein